MGRPLKYGEKSQYITYRLPASLLATVRKQARAVGMNFSEYTTKIMGENANWTPARKPE